jgi:hypothetical protein
MGLEICGGRGTVVHARVVAEAKRWEVYNPSSYYSNQFLATRPQTPMAYSQPHPRLSVLSNSSQSSVDQFSPTSSSVRHSLPSGQSIHTTLSSAKPASRPNIYDRNLNKTRITEVSASSLSFLFSEIVQYTQKRVSGINDLERRYFFPQGRLCIHSS